MTSFDERKDAYENKFAHDAELKFRAEARRNRMLGQWAAEELGKTGAEADAYALSIVQADLEEAGDEDVFRKIRADFDAAGVEQSDHQIRRQMDELLIDAAEQIEKGEEARPTQRSAPVPGRRCRRRGGRSVSTLGGGG